MRLGATAHDVASPGRLAIEGRASQAEEIRKACRQASRFLGRCANGFAGAHQAVMTGVCRARLRAIAHPSHCRLATRMLALALCQARLMLMQALRAPIGEQLRLWRERRQLSQLELSLVADVSARHLSFVENGRAQPGRDLILRLAKELDVPLRDRNALLVSAGFAPVFGQRRFDDPSFDSVRAIIAATLETHKPFPAYVIDRHWSVVASNAAIPELFSRPDCLTSQRGEDTIWPSCAVK